jgi:hypothetical protein
VVSASAEDRQAIGSGTDWLIDDAVVLRAGSRSTSGVDPSDLRNTASIDCCDEPTDPRPDVWSAASSARCRSADREFRRYRLQGSKGLRGGWPDRSAASFCCADCLIPEFSGPE